jgi:hypothetical protein
MKFSLIHPADLPGWERVARLWLEACDRPDNVEHILVTHSPIDSDPVFPHSRFLVQPIIGSVPSWNAGAKASTGAFLIGMASDLEPCPHWDSEISKIVAGVGGPVVLDVNFEDQQILLTHFFMNRAYYERYGFLCPDYTHIMVDVEFSRTARMSGCLIPAKHLIFPHVGPLHPRYPELPNKRPDKPQAQVDSEYEVGKRIYERRRRAETAGVA